MEKKTIGAFIAALRKAKGMTQQEVADRLNISNKSVSRWERDECTPDLSLIPALAEIFGVTCDELLKGERIFTETQSGKSEPKVEKQLKILINRSVSSFKTLICISLALSVVGFVCMLGISYGFFRPIIGFAVMMLFEAAAFVDTIIGVNSMKETKRENELFESADISLINRYNHILGVFSYAAYFSVISVIALSLPLIFFLSDYVDGVLAFESYSMFFVIIGLALALIFILFKDKYYSWITEQPYNKAVKNTNPKLRSMNISQFGVLTLSCILSLICPFFERANVTLPIADILLIGSSVLILTDIAIFIVYILISKSDRKELILPGVRNLLLIIPTVFVQRVHTAYFIYVGESITEDVAEMENLAHERYDDWNIEYILIALGLTLFIFMLFKVIDILRNKKCVLNIN